MQIKVKPGVPQTMDATDTRSYDTWLAAVNTYLERCVGVSVDDLPDCWYRDWYDQRLRPIRAANRALRNAGADMF